MHPYLLPRRSDGDRWRPSHGDPYFVILGDGAMHRFTWHGTAFDERAWTFGNCFRAWTEAAQARAVLHEVFLQVPQPLSNYCAKHQQYYASWCVYCGPPAPQAAAVVPYPAMTRAPAHGDEALSVTPRAPEETEHATLVCLHCGRTHRLPLAALPSPPFPGPCACGARCAMTLEERHDERKPVRLPGEYAHGAASGRMLVENISRGGLGFRTEPAPPLQVNDRLTVRFRLDDLQRSEVRAPALVRWVDGEVVGAAFLALQPQLAENLL